MTRRISGKEEGLGLTFGEKYLGYDVRVVECKEQETKGKAAE